MSRVSIIIPTYNRAALLCEAIESVLATQRADIDLEVIVSDDGSTDETSAVVRAYPVRYLGAARSAGAAAARNAGIAMATSEYLAFLDDDDLWCPGNLAPQLRAFAEHPEYGAVFGRMVLTDEHRVPVPGLDQPQRSDGVSIFEHMLAHFPQIGTIVVRAEVARAVGAFDTTLANGEEWDWMLRIARRYPCGQVSEPAVLFRRRGFGDDRINWRRIFDTITVFKRHTRSAALPQRVRYSRMLWAHRGWFASAFLLDARRYGSERQWGAALRCTGYAVYASPLHVALALLRSQRGAGPQRLSQRRRSIFGVLLNSQQHNHLPRRGQGR
ncbi:MAG TPA: glycosyltransferase [Ktedonobacterales bacterium]|nr:glycosyltransferase [Ktedonobacterales bacterium]